jgi:hypothetical protein
VRHLRASTQPALVKRVSKPKTRAILDLMGLNFLSVTDGTGLRDKNCFISIKTMGLGHKIKA